MWTRKRAVTAEGEPVQQKPASAWGRDQRHPSATWPASCFCCQIPTTPRLMCPNHNSVQRPPNEFIAVPYDPPCTSCSPTCPTGRNAPTTLYRDDACGDSGGGGDGGAQCWGRPGGAPAFNVCSSAVSPATSWAEVGRCSGLALRHLRRGKTADARLKPAPALASFLRCRGGGPHCCASRVMLNAKGKRIVPGHDVPGQRVRAREPGGEGGVAPQRPAATLWRVAFLEERPLARQHLPARTRHAHTRENTPVPRGCKEPCCRTSFAACCGLWVWRGATRAKAATLTP